MNLVKTAVVSMALLVVLTLPQAANADHAWGNYHWARTSNPFSIRIGNNMTAGWTTHFNTAVSDWSRSNVMDLVPEAGSSNKRCAMVSGTIQVCNGKYGFNGWLGLASINITGGVHITQGSAKMNDSYFSSATYNNPNEKLHVVCQEIGHTFGLGHTSEDGSSQNTCMDYFSNTGPNANNTTSTRPNQHDYDMISQIYAHLDSTTTIGLVAGFSAGFDEPGDPNNWGQLVRQSANGRSSEYVRINVNGSRTITHVYWTEEAAERCHSCDHRFEH